ncbi:hypothetical protein STEG23_002120 [Scotinomys teguina]
MRSVVSLGYIVRLCLKKQSKLNSKRLRKCESRAQQEPDFLYDCSRASKCGPVPSSLRPEFSSQFQAPTLGSAQLLITLGPEDLTDILFKLSQGFVGTCVCAALVCLMQKEEKSDPLELELQMVVSLHVDPGN